MQDIYVLKSCNEWKEHSSSKIIMAASDKESLVVAVAGEILQNDMGYKGLFKEAGYLELINDIKKGEINFDNLNYGYVGRIECLSMEDKDELRKLYEQAYDMVEAIENCSDEESDEYEL